MNTIAIRSLLLFLVFTLAHIAPAAAATYYVSPNGTATWAQATNINTPTDGRTAMLNAVAGDIVYFRGGTYKPSNNSVPNHVSASTVDKWKFPHWNPVNSGTPSNYITFAVYPGETATITHDTVSAPLGVNSKSYIIFDGFTGGTKVSAQAFIFLGDEDPPRDTTYCIVQNCYFANGFSTPDGGLNNSHIFTRYVQYCTIRNNYLANNICTTGNHNSAGIITRWTNDTIFENNTFYNNTCGMYAKHIDANVTIRYNFFVNNINKDIRATYGSGYKIYQNVVVGSTNVAVETESLPNLVTTGTEIYNNTFYVTNSSGLGLYNINEKQWNNITVNATNCAYRSIYAAGLSDGQPTYMDYNAYWNGQRFVVRIGTYTNLPAWQSSGALIGGGNPDTHSIYANPLFVNAGGTTPADYKLQANSPCRNVGRNGVTMGAYINGNEVIGYIGSGISTTTTSIDTRPPDPPTGLRIIE